MQGAQSFDVFPAVFTFLTRMHLDVVIPTYNRAALLPSALRSLARAEPVPELAIRVFVVDNNSSDDTRRVVAEHQQLFGSALTYLFEPRQGRSHALNTGIAAGHGELVGMIDDDEEVDESWLQVIARAFRDLELDFIGGPYLAKLTGGGPAWLPAEFPAVIGHIPGNEPMEYVHEGPRILMGGNAVLRRAILEKVGPYDPALGRTNVGLLSGEDHDMYDRLMAAGARGRYLPELIVHHHVPPERLTKRYHRRWCFWHGVSMGRMDRTRRKQVPYMAGIPRYMLGLAARGLLANVVGVSRRRTREAELFGQELRAWSVAGFMYGKWLRS